MELSKNTKVERAEENNLVRDLFFKYLSYWPLFLSLLLITFALAWFYLQYTIPKYRASATLMIKDQQRGMQDARLLQQLNFFESSKTVENEIEVLNSRSVLRDVAVNLKLYSPVSQERTLNDVSAYTISPIVIEVQKPEAIVEQSGIYFDFDQKKKTVLIDDVTYPMNKWVLFRENTVRFIPNPAYVATSDKKPLYFSLIDVRKIASWIGGSVKISPANKVSSVITLKMDDEVPKRAEDILDEMLKVYANIAIDEKNELTANTLAFVEDRLHFVVSELDSVESVMQRYKSTKGIVDISTQGKLFLESVESNDQRISSIDGQLAVLDQVEKYVLYSDDRKGIAPSTIGLNDVILSRMVENLSEFEIQYERLRKTTAENNPILVSLQSQIERLKPNILENIRNQRNNLSAEKRSINSSNQKYTSVLKTIPQKERELLEISRQQTIKNDIYLFLLQRREETALSFASIAADSRMVDNAEASLAPVSPKKSIVFLIALLGAFAIAIPIITIRELFNRNIQNRSEIEKYVSLPIIGEIAYDYKKKPIVIKSGEKTFIAEQFRQIRASLAYLGINAGKKKLLVTSSIPGDGKTFVTVNLGISLALTDKKVVILELDLRKPKLSEIFTGKTEEVGITEFLIGKENAGSIIKKSEVHENLFVIPAGSIPPNPSELLLNGKIEELLTYLESRFDYILMDTAPVYPVTDARILSKLCDATLFVVRYGSTPKAHVRMLEENNSVMGLKNVAIVFNGVKAVAFEKNNYAYSYGYSKNGDLTNPGKKKFKQLLN